MQKNRTTVKGPGKTGHSSKATGMGYNFGTAAGGCRKQE